MDRKYDIAVFGATGFTGQFVVKELAIYHSEIKWCVAGRSTEKLIKLLKDIGKEIDKSLDHIDVICAETNDESSLADMCKSATVIVNCVGPYRFYGEKVVEQCVKNGAHHVDISGEPHFLETVQLKYFDEAKEKGIYIVGACGFDSIPSDFGIEVIRKKFEGDVHSVETYLVATDGAGSSVNFATWQSAVYGLANAAELKSLRKLLKEKIFPKPLPRSSYKLEKKSLLFKSDVVDGWCMPFMGSDHSVVTRTQMFNYHYKNERPVQAQCFMRINSLFNVMLLIVMGSIFMFMTKFSMGRYLLEKYPEIFSLGHFTKNPDKNKITNSKGKFSMIFKARGWTEKLLDPDDQHTTIPNKTVTAVLKGPEPGYIGTSIMLVNAALVVLQEKEKMPLNGGVLTPGAAFINTSLAKRLESRGITISGLKSS